MVDEVAKGSAEASGRIFAVWQMLGLAAGVAAASLAGLFLAPSMAGDVVMLRGAGVAMAALLAFGTGLWPGVLFGALLSRLVVHWVGAGTFPPVAELIDIGVMPMVVTAQALIGTFAIRRLFGTPIHLRGFGQLALAGCVVVPLTCALVPSFGIALFAVSHPPGSAHLVESWVLWWLGDLIGVILAVPVAVLGPWNRAPVVFWSRTALPQFTWPAIAYLALSVAVTLLAWQEALKMGNRSDRAQFDTMVGDNAQALRYRMESYALALGGGVGLVRASDRVTREDWRRYVAALNLPDNLPGLNGVGFVQPVDPAAIDEFLAEARRDGVEALTIKPGLASGEMFVVRYLEPIGINQTALGLNIAFEDKRRNAAIDARDSGQVRITQPVELVQDNGHGPGFVLLSPVYSGTSVPQSVAERRAAFVGWVVAPINGEKMLESVTDSQGENLWITFSNVAENGGASQFYTNAADPSGSAPPRFRRIEQFDLFGETWLIKWESSPAFEARMSNAEPKVILAGGLLFTLLFAILLLTLIRREDLITETVARRTRELAAQVEENRSIIESAVSKIAFLDEKGTILRVNDALVRLLGGDRQAMIGRPFSSLVDDHLTEYFQGAPSEEETPTYRGELHATSTQGQVLTLDVQIVPWRNTDGNLRFTAVMRNITEQRRAQDQLRTTQHRLDLALTGAKLGVFDIDLRTGKSVVSRTWMTLLGYDEDDAIDAQKNWRERVHPDDLPMLDADDLACIEGRSSRSLTEYRVRMRDGTWRWMRSDAVGEDRDATGRAWRLIGLQSDVTDQRQVDELKSQFVSTVSHELRTPLTSINGSITLLLNTMSDGIPEAARRMLSIAQKNCGRLILLVNDILDLEKLEAGPQKPELTGLDLVRQVRRAIEVNRPFAENFSVTYRLTCDDPDIAVMLEEHRFQQVMANLLSNAAKFSPRGGTVDVAIRQAGDTVTVSVTDHGPGIPAGSRDRLFKAFSQIDGSANRKTEGSGLGLYIAKKTMEQLGGEIGFDSEPGVATTFWVRFRTAPRDRTDGPADDAPPSAADPRLSLPKLLHIEDDPDFATVLKAAFGPEARLVSAASLSAARACLKGESYDLIILDWQLGGEDVGNLLSDIRDMQPGTPVVALTAMEHHAQMAKMDAVFIKTRVMLDHVVRRCLDIVAHRHQAGGKLR